MAGWPGPTWPAGRAGWHGQDHGLHCSRDDTMKRAVERWRSHKNIGRDAREGEGAAARQRESTTRCDANKPELIDFEQGERTTNDKRRSRVGRHPAIAVDPFAR